MRRRWGLACAVAALAACWAGVVSAQQVEARLDRSRIGLGETTVLRLTVRGGGNVREPVFELPEGLRALGTGRQQSFSWVNGRASSETEFRIEILAEAVGRFAIGPIDVSVEGKTFRGAPVSLEVLEGPPDLGGGGGGRTGPAPATLSVDVQPQSPYVGQAMTLRVRLVQRAAFAEDPQYIPPTTTGFWTDRFSAPESYYADLRGERVLVTETRARLFPLAVGDAEIGEAAAQVVVASGGADPFQMQGRSLRVRSQPVRVRVRPLPRGAPNGFTGGVGTMEARWTADREHTSRDVPVTVRLDIRGRGNLPLMRPPDYAPADFDVFASSVEDSAAAEGAGAGRKRFQWTLLPRREGKLTITPPAFAWFDPGSNRYRSAVLAPIEIEVGPSLLGGGGGGVGLPRELAARPVHPGGREPAPWAFALAGCALGCAFRLWRRRPPPEAATEGPIRRWLSEVRSARGAQFWPRAEEVMRELEALEKVAEESRWRDARAQVAAARYGGAGGDPERVRRVLVEQLERALPPPGRGAVRRGAAIALALAGVLLAVLLGPRPGQERYARLALEADQWARRGELARARTAWQALWREGGEHPGLAARLAWEGMQSGDVGRAALWVLRGELAGARDPALAWVTDRVREAGGLMGSGITRLPVRDLEWSLIAFVMALAGCLLWRRRTAWSIATGVVALIAAVTMPIERGWVQASGRAVVLRATRLEGTDVDLDPGQVVRVRSGQNGRVRVQIGRMTEGWLPAASIGRVEDQEAAG